MLFLSVLCVAKTLAFDITDDDIVGIYRFNNYGENEYITINRNKDQYVVINISKDLIFLKALALRNGSISLPIENFAITFSLSNSSSTTIKSFLIEPFVPRDTTAEIGYYIPRMISFFERDDVLYACVNSEPPYVDIIPRCYKKLF